jgi:hypothetical protein
VGGRRKLLALGVLTVLAFAIVVPMLASGAAPTVPSSNINDYALYAYQTVKLKGGGSPPESVIDGNIGAGTRHFMPGNIDEYSYGNEMLTNTNTPALSGYAHVVLCQGTSGGITLAKGSYVAAPSVQINYVSQGTSDPPTLLPSDPCQVPSVYAPLLYKSFNTPTSVWNWNFTPPDITMPTIPAATCDTTKTNLSFVGTTLAPGVYGSYDFQKVTTLSAGTYTFCNLTVEQGATLITQPNTVINLTGSINLKGGANGSVGACGTVFNIAGGLAFGRNGRYSGTFIAPNTDASLGDSTLITGHVWANTIHSDSGVGVPKCPPPTGTTTTTAAPTTTSTSTTTSTTTTTTTTVPKTTTTTTTVPKTTTTTTTTVPPPTTSTTLPET